MSKRIVATGASGFIGSALVDALRARGDTVRVLNRSGSMDLWNPAEGTLDPALIDGADAVVNLSGAGIGDKRWTDARKKVIVDSRVDATSLLARTIASVDDKPGVFISASAIGYYGDTGHSIVDETSAHGNDFHAEICIKWEEAADAARDTGVRVVHPRTGIVLGTHGGALKPMLPLFKMGLGGKLGSGDQWWSWVTLEDEVRALMFLIDGDLDGPVNIAAPNPVPNTEVTRALGEALGRPTVIPVPKFALDIRLGRELAESLGYGSVRVSSQKLTDAGFEFNSSTIDEGVASALS